MSILRTSAGFVIVLFKQNGIDESKEGRPRCRIIELLAGEPDTEKRTEGGQNG